MNWFEWFNFSSDPFIVAPLQSDEEFNTLFVKTDLVDKELSYISSQVKSDPFLLLTIGNRGVGKSTILQYVVNLCRKNDVISVYVGLLPYGIKSSREPIYELSRQIMKSLIQELILEIYTNRNDLFKKYENTFISWGRYVSLSYDSIEGFYRDPGYQLDFSVLRDVLLGIMEIVNKHDANILIAIDNLDKLASNVVVNFLKGGTAQPLLETLNNYGASVLIASDPRTAEIIDKDVDLSYLKRRIEIAPLSPIEAEQLISLRVNRYSRGPSSSYYDKRAVLYICNEYEGITRDIINEVRKLFEKAYKDNTKYVTYDMALDTGEIFDERGRYYSLIKDDVSRKGVEKLLNFVYSIPEGKEYDIARYLYGIYEGKRLRIPGNVMRELLKNNIIFSDRSLPRGYKLDLDVYYLFNSLITLNWDLIEFLKWIFRIDTLDIVRIQTPGSRGYACVEKLMKEASSIKYPHDEILLIRNNEEIYYDVDEWRYIILSQLKKLDTYYEELTYTDIEDANTKTLIHLVYIILKNYLLIYTKLIGAISERPIRYHSDNPNIDNWIYIWAGIHYYQRNYNYWFKNYDNIRKILNFYSEMKDKSSVPSFSEIEHIIYCMEEIILEFSNQLDNSLSNYVITNGFDGRKLNIETLNLLKNRIDEAILNMGYYDDLTLYDDILDKKLSLIIGDDVINDNIIFIRHKIKQINNKDSKHYFICLIYKNVMNITPILMMSYVRAFSNLIDIIEINDEVLSLKNRYSVLIYSQGGYDGEVNNVINKTRVPLRTSIELLNSFTINSFLNTYNVTNIEYNLLRMDYEKDKDVLSERKESHVFILYKSGNKLSEGSAKKLCNYLESKKIKTYLFKKEVGWGDSITDFEEHAIENAFATIICYTKDFKEGKTASEEYRAVLAKRRSNSDFKVGLLLINCGDEDIPPFMKDYFYAKITDLTDEEFTIQAEIIYKGILDLPID